MVYLDAALLEFRIEAILQVRLGKPPVLVVALFGEDLSDVASFYIITAILIAPRLWYILPAFEGQLLWVSKDMEPLPWNGAPPLPALVSFYFTKFRIGLLSSTVHGFVNVLCIRILNVLNCILLKFVFNTCTIEKILLNAVSNYEHYFRCAMWCMCV